MRTITVENSKRKYHVLKEYPRYYLCKCIYDGEPVYRECFLKVEVDKIKEVPVVREKYKGTGWHM